MTGSLRNTLRLCAVFGIAAAFSSACAPALGQAANTLAQSQPAPAQNAPQSTPVYTPMQTMQITPDVLASKWTDITPSKTNTDFDATLLAHKLLDEKTKYVFEPSTLNAIFFNAPGLEKNSFVIAMYTQNCGSSGCETYFLKKREGSANSWRIVSNENVNRIIVPKGFEGKTANFFVKGLDEYGFASFSAVGGAYNMTINTTASGQATLSK